MRRSQLLALGLIVGLALCDAAMGARRGQVIPEPAARRHGLTRPWFTQVQLDSARARISEITLDRGTLFVQTDTAVVHAIDAETGRTHWAVEVGRRGHPSFAPGANDMFVAVVNGSFLYVLNRENGKLLWKTQLEGAPGAGAALSARRAYVPMVDGLVMSYLLTPLKDPVEEMGLTRRQQEELSPEDEEALEKERREAIRLSQEYVPPLACQSYGRSLVQPLVTRHTPDEEYVTWPTDRGILFVGYVARLEEQFTMLYQLQTESGIAAQPAYLPPNPDLSLDRGLICAASRDGYVHALEEKDGDPLWRFPTAEPILEAPVAIGANIYVATQPGGMYCLNALDGTEKWWAPQVAQFIAASNDRLYVVDKLDRILVLDAASGARLDTIYFPGQDIKLVNIDTDRIYLAARTGLIQCLHEAELAEPIVHRKPIEPPTEEEAKEEETPAVPESKPTEAPAPGGAAPNPFAPQANPFANPDADPFR
jgi:hypothetical protein